MIKLRGARNERERLSAIADFVQDHASHVLDHPSSPMAQEDSALLRLMQKGLSDDLRQLEQLFALTLNGAASEVASQLVGKLMLRAHGIGSFAVHSPEAEQWRGMVRAFGMRNARAGKPERIALCDAIKAAHGDTPVSQPNKEAAAIFDTVNKTLGQNGFEPVKVDVIRRELEKGMPRSSRARK